MGKEHFILRISFLILILLVFSGCSGFNSGEAPTTSTAQAERAIRMATDIAEDMQATVEVIYLQALATADARLALFEEASRWPLIFGDTFDENIHEWAEGEDDDPLYANIQWSLSDGIYHWEVKAYDGFIWWVRPDMGTFSDFYLAVTAQQISNPEYGEYGLIFRQTDDGDYYLFELDEQGNYAFFIHFQGEWESLLDWQFSPEITIGEENRLAVIALGDEFHFFINDTFIDAIVDDRLDSGKAGLLIGLSNPGEDAIWEFDDFEIRSSGVTTDEETPTP